MRISPLPSLQVLNSLLTYEPSTGELHWKKRLPEMFDGQQGEHAAKRWNTRFADAKACSSMKSGHMQTTIKGKKFLAHRLVWKLAYGEDPQEVIDHIDGDPENNRIENLRVVSQTINTRNAKLGKNNVTGINGVSYVPRLQRWQSRIMVDRKSISLGYFRTMQEAVDVRLKANETYGFHENHGRRTSPATHHQME